MSLQIWLKSGWLQAHKTTPEEIRDLLLIVERDLKDASTDALSHDWQYGIAYNAALKLCTILLYAEGYTSGKGQGSHIRPINALPLILGDGRRRDADYLDGCRQKRNKVEYDYIGGASKEDAETLIEFCHELRTAVLAWLKEKHPNLVPPV
jgi:uncharacterized protein (UPF0332 family)